MNNDAESFVPKHGLLLVSIRKSIKNNRGISVYDATRYAWPVDQLRVEREVDFVLGCVNGVVQGVFKPTEWLDAMPGEATEKNFPGLLHTHHDRRWGFVGEEADDSVKGNYLGKHVPADLKIPQQGFRYSPRKAG